MRTLGRPCDQGLIAVAGARTSLQCNDQIRVCPGFSLWPLQISECIVEQGSHRSEFRELSQETRASFPVLESTDAHRRKHNRTF